jgi:L-lactate dehydrogenase complex protein LldF
MDDARDAARRIRLHTLANLDAYLGQFADRLAANGGEVHWAADAEEAARIVTGIAAATGARTAVKSKSMVTEEIGLNRALETAGVDVAETDLGEFIVQLADDTPSHIVAPIMHKTRRDVGELCAGSSCRPISASAASTSP